MSSPHLLIQVSAVRVWTVAAGARECECRSGKGTAQKLRRSEVERRAKDGAWPGRLSGGYCRGSWIILLAAVWPQSNQILRKGVLGGMVMLER